MSKLLCEGGLWHPFGIVLQCDIGEIGAMT